MGVQRKSSHGWRSSGGFWRRLGLSSDLLHVAELGRGEEVDVPEKPTRCAGWQVTVEGNIIIDKEVSFPGTKHQLHHSARRAYEVSIAAVTNKHTPCLQTMYLYHLIVV